MLLDIARRYRDTSAVVLLADGPYVATLEAAGVCVHVLRTRPALHAVRRESPRPSLGAVLALPALCREIAKLAAPYDLIYANSQKAFLVACGAGILARRPVLWHLHDILTTEHFSQTNIRLDVALANRVAVRVLAVSHAAADAFVAGGGNRAKVRVVHNGVDPQLFLSAKRQSRVRSELRLSGIPHSAPLVGCFSRLSQWKGQHIVLDALRELPEAHAMFVGDSLFGQEEYSAQLRARAATLGISDRVHFLGARADVPNLMCAADVIVHPSIAPEPFARVVIEAMLSGKPLVASRGGGTVEIVEHGKNGLLFTPGNATELASAVGRLLSNPKEASDMGNAARSYAVANLSLQSMLAEVGQHVREVVHA